MKPESIQQNLYQTLTAALGMVGMGGLTTEGELIAYAREINANAPSESILDVDDVDAVARRVWREHVARPLTPAEAVEVLRELTPDQVKVIEEMLNSDAAHNLLPFTTKALIALLPR